MRITLGLFSVYATMMCWSIISAISIPPAPSFVRSIPIIMPRPRTSLITWGNSFAMASIPFLKYAPVSALRCSRFSSSITCRVATPAAQAICPPPKVDVCRNGASINPFQAASVPITEPMGIMPPPRALATAIRSGFAPSCSTPNQVPVRPIPVCTSSAISSAPFLCAISSACFM